MKLEYSRLALSDLSSIAAFIYERDQSASQRFVLQLQEACNLIARHPEAWPAYQGLPIGYRVRYVQRYAIYYRFEPGEKVVIVGILHSARDQNKVLSDRLKTQH